MGAMRIMKLPQSAAPSLRGALSSAVAFSGIMNLLGLAGPLFMLEIYDRVLPSRSTPTLVALLLLVGGLFAFWGLFDVLRSRIMARIAASTDTLLSERVFAVITGTALKARVEADALRPVQDLDQIRGFLAGSGPAALFDLPWTPVYLLVCFLLHPLIGWCTFAGLIVLSGMTLATGVRTRSLVMAASLAQGQRNRYGEAAYRDAEAIAAMSMAGRALRRWQEAQGRLTTLQRQAADIAGTMAGVAKAGRYALQSGMLGLGAYLVIANEMTAGSIVAGSIIVTKALAPAEEVIGNWRGMSAARQAWKRLHEIFALFPPEPGRTAIPLPSHSLSAAALFVAPPSDPRRLTVQNVSLDLTAGTVLGVVGPSGSGKSSLIRGLVGVWPLLRGSVRVDGATLDQWPDESRGRFIGYMPQAVTLFPGTIAENIARLDAAASDADIVEAAQAAAVHDLIVGLPDGYETRVGDGGIDLSAGQRQRVALARALYGSPFLVVLDEPNSNLDSAGEQALIRAIQNIRSRGGIVIIVAHRTSILSTLDLVLVMEAGATKSFGAPNVLLKAVQRQPAAALKVLDREGSAA